jgi:hypothetical protein
MESNSPSLSIEERAVKARRPPAKKRKVDNSVKDRLKLAWREAGNNYAAYYQGLVDASTLERNADTMTDSLRIRVWDNYFNRHSPIAICPCCNTGVISESANRFDFQTFEAGHIFPRSRGGTLELANLIPICRKCNGDMGAQHLYSYAWKTYGIALWRA